jgi:hypothetical protein
MAGIQSDDNGQVVYVGKIKPRDEKFFMTISEISKPLLSMPHHCQTHRGVYSNAESFECCLRPTVSRSRLC